jgi:hypothetical protein
LIGAAEAGDDRGGRRHSGRGGRARPALDGAGRKPYIDRVTQADRDAELDCQRCRCGAVVPRVSG